MAFNFVLDVQRRGGKTRQTLKLRCLTVSIERPKQLAQKHFAGMRGNHIACFEQDVFHHRRQGLVVEDD